MPSIRWRDVKDVTRGLEQLCEVTTHPSLSGSLLDDTGFDEHQEKESCLCASCKVKWRRVVFLRLA